MKKIIFPLLLILILSFFTIRPLLKSGYFSMHDDTQIVRVYEMKKSLLDGMLPVRWVEDLGYGYGYPIFNYYAPLPYYVGASFNLAGFDSIVATKLMFGIGILLSGVTMFFFLKKFFGVIASVAGSIIYLYFPYHAVNIYVRGAVGEYFAYAFLPLVFLFLFSLFENFRRRKELPFKTIILLSVSIFLVTISHNLSAFMTFLISSFFAVISLVSVKFKKQFLISIILAFVLGLCLSAFYFLPAVFESNYTNVSSQVGGGADYNNHFVCIEQFWNSQWGFGGSTPSCIDGLSFKLGKQNIILFFFSTLTLFYFLLKKKKEKTIFFINLLLLTFSVFLTLPYSRFVWDNVPFMPYLQYPWRFINFIALFLAFSITYLLYEIKENSGKNISKVAVLSVLVLTIFINAKLFLPQTTTVKPPAFYTDKHYINFDVSKISDEYMPKNFAKPTEEKQLPISLIISEAQFANVNKTTTKITADYISSSNTFANINLAYFPAWHAYLNNREVNLVKTSNGMRVNIPKGGGHVEIIFKQTPIEIIGNIITLAVFFGLFLTFVVQFKTLTKVKNKLARKTTLL